MQKGKLPLGELALILLYKQKIPNTKCPGFVAEMKRFELLRGF